MGFNSAYALKSKIISEIWQQLQKHNGEQTSCLSLASEWEISIESELSEVILL